MGAGNAGKQEGRKRPDNRPNDRSALQQRWSRAYRQLQASAQYQAASPQLRITLMSALWETVRAAFEANYKPRKKKKKGEDKKDDMAGGGGSGGGGSGGGGGAAGGVGISA